MINCDVKDQCLKRQKIRNLELTLTKTNDEILQTSWKNYNFFLLEVFMSWNRTETVGAVPHTLP